MAIFTFGGKKRRTLAEIGPAALVASEAFEKVTPSATPFASGPCRSLWSSNFGTATLLRTDGTSAVDFPLMPGLNPLAVAGVSSVTGAEVWAMY